MAPRRLLALALLCALMLVFPYRLSAQAEPQSMPQRLRVRWLGQAGGSSLAVAVRGQYAYLGQSAEFAVIDLQTGSDLKRVAYLPIAANDIALGGDYAYVTNQRGLGTIDIAVNDQPKLVSFVPLPVALNAVAVQGNYLYASAPRAGLYVFAIENPAYPKQVAFLPASRTEAIALAGTQLYLASAAGLQVVNITDPRQPRLGVLARTPRPVESIVVAGQFAYLTVTPGALVVADLADPAAPTFTGATEIPTFTKNLQVIGNTAYVANGNRGLAIVDVTEASGPRLLAVQNTGSLVTDVAATRSQIVVTDVSEGGLRLLQPGDGGSPPKTVGVYRAPGVVNALATRGHYAYGVAGLEGAVVTVDFEDAHNPIVTDYFVAPARLDHLHTAGELLYTYGPRSVIEVFNLRDAGHPAPIESCPLAKGAQVLATDHRWIFVGDGGSVLQIYDTQGNTTPQVAAMLAVGSPMLDLAMTDDTLLVTLNSGDLLAAQFADKVSAVRLERVPIPGHAQFVAAAADKAFVVTREGDLIALDLSGPGRVQVVDQLALGVHASAITLADDRLYIAAGEEGVYLLDVSDGHLHSVTVYDTPGNALAVEPQGDTLLVADGFAGLLLLQVKPEVFVR